MKKIRWGIVGAARIVDRMLHTIANADNGELIAIGSRRPGAAKACLVKMPLSLKMRYKLLMD